MSKHHMRKQNAWREKKHELAAPVPADMEWNRRVVSGDSEPEKDRPYATFWNKGYEPAWKRAICESESFRAVGADEQKISLVKSVT